jgi:hypothetical protein
LARTNHRGFDRAFHSITGDYHGRKEEGRKEGCQEVWREEGLPRRAAPRRRKEGRRSKKAAKKAKK